jgi:outer membrane protein assembly factor BamD (BamD/ComL family)
MLRILFAFAVSTLLLTGFSGCKKTQSAAEVQLAKKKAFQDRQKVEAIKTYTALVEKYPDSEFAAKAKERLGVLGPMPTATPKKK